MVPKGKKEISGDIDVENKKEAVKHLSNIPYVGKKTAGLLYDAGFKTVLDVQQADVTELSMIVGIGKKLGSLIKTGADELEVVMPEGRAVEEKGPPAQAPSEIDEEEESEDEPEENELEEDVTEEPEEDVSTEEHGEDEHEDDGRTDPATVLLQWQLDGFDVSTCEEMLFDNKDEQEQILQEFTDNIEKLEELKKTIEQKEFPENMDEKVQNVLDMLCDPMKIDEIEAKVRELDEMKKGKMIEAELEGIEGHEEEKEKIRKLAEDPSTINKAEKELHKLRRKIKESFFELEFSKTLESTEEEPAVKTKKVVIERKPAVEKSHTPMIVDAVFLANDQGRPMSFRTRRPRSEVGMKWLKGAAASVKKLVSTNSGNTGDVLEGAFSDHKILVYKGELTNIAVIYKGKEHQLGRRMLKTALGVMEAKHYPELKNWDGKSGVTSVGKSMNAIIPAFIKLNKLSRKK